MVEVSIDSNNELISLRGKLSSLTQEYDDKMRNPKVYKRQLQVLGSKITKMNYTIGNKIVELSNALESRK